MRQFSEWRAVQAQNVHAYVMDTRSKLLDRAHPWLVPYNDRTRLKMMLEDSTIRDILPANVRMPLPFARCFHDGFDYLPREPSAGDTYVEATSDATSGDLRVEDLHSRFPYLRVPVSVRDGHELSLELLSKGGKTADQTLAAGMARQRWTDVIIGVPGADFSLLAHDGQADHIRFAVGPPVEMGRLSRWTESLLDASPVFLWLSAIAAGAGALFSYRIRFLSGDRSPRIAPTEPPGRT
jgi:hypothetical protein